MRSFRDYFTVVRPWVDSRSAKSNAVPWSFVDKQGRSGTAHIGPYLAVSSRTAALQVFEVIPKEKVVARIQQNFVPHRGETFSFEVVVHDSKHASVLAESSTGEALKIGDIEVGTIPRVTFDDVDHSADYHGTLPPSDPSKRPTRFITKKCKACGVFTSVLVTPEEFMAAQRRPDWRMGEPKPKGLYFFQGSTCLACRGCGKTMYASPVRGIYNPKKTCNAKCMASHGPVCECACGGKNHGASFSAT